MTAKRRRPLTRLQAAFLGLDPREFRHLPAAHSFEEWFAQSGLPMFQAEYQFAAARGRKWAFDYAWPALRIAFEQEGAAFGRRVKLENGTFARLGGRHNTGRGFEDDCEKYSTAAALGWCVIRGTTTMIRDGKIQPLLLEAFKLRGWKQPEG